MFLYSQAMHLKKIYYSLHGLRRYNLKKNCRKYKIRRILYFFRDSRRLCDFFYIDNLFQVKKYIS